MRQFYIQFVFLVLVITCVQGQSIRKNFLEMTDNEKLDLVNALYQLRTGPDLFNDLANFHGNYFAFNNSIDPNGLSIHFNLPDRPENEIFLPWHRVYLHEIEMAMQDINPNISMPYWDSSTEQSVNSTLWDQNFLGQFDTDWSLGRNLGGGNDLPSVGLVNNIQSRIDFFDYSNSMERFGTHTGAHSWTGGAMVTAFSPRDPVFYLHHANVDRWWSEWQEVNQNSVFIRTDMLRYDGTYVFNGNTLPLVNPNDIVDTRYFGTFYAKNGLVNMDKYTVNNTYRSLEKFYYQFTIQAGNNFIIPNNGNCEFESVNEIILQPGFEARSGSSFLAKIDNTLAKNQVKNRNEIVRNQIPFDDFGELPNVYDNYGKEEIKVEVGLNELFPNPFDNQLNIKFNKDIDHGKVVIFDLTGRIVVRRDIIQSSQINISGLSELSSGIYLIHVTNQNNKLIMNKKVVKK